MALHFSFRTGIITLLIFACSLLPVMAVEEEGDAALNDFKSTIGFLSNFTQFTQWPEERSPIKNHLIQICVGNDSKFLDYFVANHSQPTATLSLDIKKVTSGEQAKGCNILYIGGQDESAAFAMAEAVKNDPVLTISEIKHFAENSGIIELIPPEKRLGLFAKRKLVFRVNLKNAEKAHLHIDARLLQIATEIIR